MSKWQVVVLLLALLIWALVQTSVMAQGIDQPYLCASESFQSTLTDADWNKGWEVGYDVGTTDCSYFGQMRDQEIHSFVQSFDAVGPDNEEFNVRHCNSVDEQNQSTDREWVGDYLRTVANGLVSCSDTRLSDGSQTTDSSVYAFISSPDTIQPSTSEIQQMETEYSAIQYDRTQPPITDGSPPNISPSIQLLMGACTDFSSVVVTITYQVPSDLADVSIKLVGGSFTTIKEWTISSSGPGAINDRVDLTPYIDPQTNRLKFSMVDAQLQSNNQTVTNQNSLFDTSCLQ